MMKNQNAKVQKDTEAVEEQEEEAVADKRRPPLGPEYTTDSPGANGRDSEDSEGERRKEETGGRDCSGHEDIPFGREHTTDLPGTVGREESSEGTERGREAAAERRRLSLLRSRRHSSTWIRTHYRFASYKKRRIEGLRGMRSRGSGRLRDRDKRRRRESKQQEEVVMRRRTLETPLGAENTADSPGGAGCCCSSAAGMSTGIKSSGCACSNRRFCWGGCYCCCASCSEILFRPNRSEEQPNKTI